MNETGGVFTREKQEGQSQTGEGMTETEGQKAAGRRGAAGSEDAGRAHGQDAGGLQKPGGVKAQTAPWSRQGCAPWTPCCCETSDLSSCHMLNVWQFVTAATGHESAHAPARVAKCLFTAVRSSDLGRPSRARVTHPAPLPLRVAWHTGLSPDGREVPAGSTAALPRPASAGPASAVILPRRITTELATAIKTQCTTSLHFKG